MMRKNITDTEAVNQLCEKTGEFYSKAQSLQSIDSDAEALVNYRSALKVLLTTLAERHCISLQGEHSITTLHEDICTVTKHLKLNIHIENLMNKIRHSGNKGSHPECYPEEDLQTLAQSTKRDFLELVKKLPSTLTGIEKNTNITITESDNCIELKELSYQALCLDDKKAAYMVANYLLTSSDLLKNYTVYKSGFNHYTLERVVPLLESCYLTVAPAAYCLAKLVEAFGTDILSQRSAGNILTQRSAGYILAKDKIENNKIAIVSWLLEYSAYRGDIRAEYEYGVMLMEGKPPFEQDIEEALDHLEHSSAYGEARASEYLSTYYANKNSPRLCEKYLKRSAEQGLIESKINYARFLLDSGDVSQLGHAKVYLEDVLNEWTVKKAVASYWLAKVLEASPEKPEDYTERLKTLYVQAANRFECDLDLTANRLLEICRKLDKLGKSRESWRMLMSCTEVFKREGDEKLLLFTENILRNTKSYMTVDCELIVKLPPLLHEDYRTLNFIPIPLPRSIPEIPEHIGRKFGRNEQCPCGSRKKFKKCCAK